MGGGGGGCLVILKQMNFEFPSKILYFLTFVHFSTGDCGVWGIDSCRFPQVGFKVTRIGNRLDLRKMLLIPTSSFKVNILAMKEFRFLAFK